MFFTATLECATIQTGKLQRSQMRDAAAIVVVFPVPGGPKIITQGGIVSGGYSKKGGNTMGHDDGLLANHRLHNRALGIIQSHRTNNGIRVAFIHHVRGGMHVLPSGKPDAPNERRSAKILFACEKMEQVLIVGLLWIRKFLAPKNLHGK